MFQVHHLAISYNARVFGMIRHLSSAILIFLRHHCRSLTISFAHLTSDTDATSVSIGIVVALASPQSQLFLLVLFLPKQVHKSIAAIRNVLKLSSSTCCNPPSSSNLITRFLAFFLHFSLHFAISYSSQ